MRKYRSKMVFTLIEIVIVLVIIAILATLIIPVYFNIIEKSKNAACETNQRVLLGALEMYAAEHTVLPASLSQLRKKDIQRSWAKIISEPGSWKIRLAYAIADASFKQLVYAANGWLQEYVGLVGGPACPNDLTPPPLNSSYGINAELVNQPSAELINANMDMAVIADSDTETFIYPTARHTKHSITGASQFAIAISRDNTIVYFPQDPAQVSFTGFDSTVDRIISSAAAPKQCKRKCASIVKQACLTRNTKDHCENVVEDCKEACHD